MGSFYPRWTIGALGLGAAVAVAMPAGAALNALGKLQPGLYQLRDKEGHEAPFRVCAANTEVLTRLRHRQMNCTNKVFTNEGHESVVEYTCGGEGMGRTHIRVETPRLAQIDTQGLSGAAPFANRYEARRIGDCR